MQGIRFCFLLLLFTCSSFKTISQLFQNQNKYTLADSLRGTLSDSRICYDVTYYNLDLRVDTTEQSIQGFNKIFFKVLESTRQIQIDLFQNLVIQKIILDDTLDLSFIRNYNAVFVNFSHEIKLNSLHTITVFYSGKPLVGKMLPWDGGFKWTKDKLENQWIAVACQGLGASVWWPNKDHQSDEPDSMLISLSVPENLMAISNGRLRLIKKLPGGYHRYDWFVSYPVNNYNVTLNIGVFKHLNDVHINNSDTLSLDYYVLTYNEEKAKMQFKQVNPMLNCFEKYFGKFPFYRDGYKLIETPYLGMEHQSAIAYGNKYKTGYNGTDYSGIGLDFDYIVIHESAHEWWGNSITSKDIADMWIHEGFASYAEVLYTECIYDSATASKYANIQRRKIVNDKPVIGPYGVNKEGSGDMYPKGLIMLNTIRHIINNDALWFSIIKNLQDTFGYATVTTHDIENFISQKSNINLQPVFDQYLRHTEIPVLEIKNKSKGNPNSIEYRWTNTIKGFNMPVNIQMNKEESKFIYPLEDWQSMEIRADIENVFRDTENLYYIKVKME